MVSLFGLVVFSSPWIVFGCVAAAYTRVDLSEVAIRIWLNLGIGFYGLMMLLLPLGFTVMDHPRIAHHIWPWVWVLLVGTFLNAFHFLVFKLLKRDLLKCSTFDL